MNAVVFMIGKRRVGPNKPVFSLAEIVKWCDQHPEAVVLNAHIVQKPAKRIRLKSNYGKDTLGAASREH